MATLTESVMPRRITDATAIQNHLETPNNARLAAKPTAAITTATPLRLMSPAIKSVAEPMREPAEGAA